MADVHIVDDDLPDAAPLPTMSSMDSANA